MHKDRMMGYQRGKSSHPRGMRGPGAERVQAKRWAQPAWLWGALLGLWVTLLIATPISVWIAGEKAFALMATLGVLAQAGATLAALARGWSVRRILAGAGLILVGAWLVEAIGSTTGFPFGSYTYTDALQPQVGSVPLLIPLAWLMMLAPAWAVAEGILAGSRGRLGRRYVPVHAGLAGLAFSAWDLYLDPQMVARHLWVWDRPGGYFGIPWVNFLGWWMAATLLTLLIRPDRLPRMRLIVIYSLTWAFQAVGLGIFWGQPGPAAAGFAGMGVFVVWSWIRQTRCHAASIAYR